MKMMKKTKRLRARHRNFMVHDEESVCRVGDTVRIQEMDRKKSKLKRHDLVEVLTSDKGGKPENEYLKQFPKDSKTVQ